VEEHAATVSEDRELCDAEGHRSTVVVPDETTITGQAMTTFSWAIQRGDCARSMKLPSSASRSAAACCTAGSSLASASSVSTQISATPWFGRSAVALLESRDHLGHGGVGLDVPLDPEQIGWFGDQRRVHLTPVPLELLDSQFGLAAQASTSST
jgi:hypothetical protein